MKLLSVKDLISNLAPCFCCKAKVEISFIYQFKPIPAQIEHNHLICQINHYHHPQMASINLTTSSFKTNYLSLIQDSYLQIQCNNCHTYTQTNKFRIYKSKILPPKVQSQYLVTYNPDYHIHSKAELNFTRLYANSNLILNLPFMPSTNFQHKHQMLDKFNKYLILK